MSKFINSSVNYSETDLLKTKYLSNILELYNQQIIAHSKTLINNSKKYIIPNNNIKYYLLIVNKNDITPNGINNKYKMCYFFPHNNDGNPYNTDFYVEIDNYKTTFTKNNYLFEGYLYSDGTSGKTFLITDVLAIDSTIIKCDYSLRYSLINKIMFNQNLNNLNGHLSINIHSIFDIDGIDGDIQTSQLFNIFKNNFIFKKEINAIEYVDEHSLKKNNQINQNDVLPEKKRITKGKYIDVYIVHNIQTNNTEDILYVKSLNDSRKLRELIRESNFIELTCKYNHQFKKWEAIF